MSQAYSDPERENDPYALPDVEVFYMDDSDCEECNTEDTAVGLTERPYTPGWYYWYCFPGCLPDSDPIGPFDTEDEAIADAQDH